MKGVLDEIYGDGFHGNNGEVTIQYTFSAGSKYVKSMKIYQSPWNWHLIGTLLSNTGTGPHL